MKKVILLLLLGAAAHSAFLQVPTLGEAAAPQARLQTPVDTTDYIAYFRQKDSVSTYSEIKAKALKTKAAINAETIGEDSLSAVFTELLVKKIIPFWYGTPWDFNGYTATPGQGVIACGYFVSTTLLHAGINVNRYKLAQQLPIHEAQSLACGEPVIEVTHETVEGNIAILDSVLQEGIYFLGLAGSHVGYILKHKAKLFVIHANYLSDSGVTIEKIEESEAFAGFREFYVAPLSRNPVLMKKWLSGGMVTVIEGDD